ncbi:glycosyltransferase [Cyanobium sp. Morenito 9A2]|nr:glycosyltransferase [Cyanobium sp. Morenito 9A2]
MLIQILELLGWLAALGLALLLLLLEVRFGNAPRLQALPAEGATEPAVQPGPFLRVVVPVFNERDNVVDCLEAILASRDPGLPWELVVMDDGSSDGTVDLAFEAIRLRPETLPLVRILEAGPRPPGERWCGKNWPASRAAALPCPPGDPSGQWLLFLDADVRLDPEALAAALFEASGSAGALGESSGADLLTLAPRLVCGCLAEWLVQPIVASLLGLAFSLEKSNDPSETTAFAAGPFMLFRRRAYEAIGGHGAVASEVVEDLALARAIKTSGHRLRYLIGTELVAVRMYRNLAALWEGWTKNWYLGVDRNPAAALGSAGLVLLLYTVPWALLPLTLLDPALAAPCGLAIALQLSLRVWSRLRFATPITYWWLAALGGLLIALIVPASIWKTVTGRGWTWRGRSLA